VDKSLICECGSSTFWLFGRYARCPRCLTEYKIASEGSYLLRRYNSESLRYSDNWERCKVNPFLDEEEHPSGHKKTSLEEVEERIRDIVHPLECLKRELKEGEELNGAYAVELLKSVDLYKDLAREALRTLGSYRKNI
jgi:hypothetical protein